MSLFSKLLAILNLLGILGLTYFATMVYTKRQAWVYAVHRHELMIEGLPLDEMETDAKGDIRAENLSEVTLKELFPANPVTTQKQEVERVQQILQGKIASAKGISEQIVRYAEFLTPFMETYSQREDLLSLQRYLKDQASIDLLKQKLTRASNDARQLLDLQANNPMEAQRKQQRTFKEAFREFLFLYGGDPKRPFEKTLLALLEKNANLPMDQAFDQALTDIRDSLKSRFDSRFQTVLNSEALGDEFRRESIADLLLAMLEFTVQESAVQPANPGNPQRPLWEEPSFRRYFRIVGIRASIPAFDRRAQMLGHFATELYVEMGRNQSLSSELALQLDRERRRFAATHQAFVDYLQVRAYHLKTQKDELARTKIQAETQEGIVMEREKDVKLFTDQLDSLRAQTHDKLVQLRNMAESLYDIRIKTRDARRLNQQYAQEIEQMENTLKKKQ